MTSSSLLLALLPPLWNPLKPWMGPLCSPALSCFLYHPHTTLRSWCFLYNHSTREQLSQNHVLGYILFEQLYALTPLFKTTTITVNVHVQATLFFTKLKPKIKGVAYPQIYLCLKDGNYFYVCVSKPQFVCPCLFLAIQLYWNFKLYCFYFFPNWGCGLPKDAAYTQMFTVLVQT